MLRVAPFDQSDAAAFQEIHLKSLAFYGLAPAAPETVADMLREYASRDGMNLLLARSDNAPVGYASWVRVFPAGRGFAVYLKELYVDGGARGQGVGRALMSALAQIAYERGATRLQWETGEAGAAEFYAALGAVSTGKSHFAVQREDLHKIIKGP